MTSAVERRLRALEKQAAGGGVPPVAFVIWERTMEAADAALQRALAAGAVKRGDPVIRGVMPEPAALPIGRWTDVAGMTDAELEAAASIETSRTVAMGNPRNMTNAELGAAIFSGVARPAA
jgi:uncharacterized protein YmfQ (DUF2313 family)